MSTERYRNSLNAHRDAIRELYGVRAQEGLAGPIAAVAGEASISADAAEGVLATSQSLTDAIAERLEGDDPGDRQLAIMQLAAGAAVDLGVAADLARQDDELPPAGTALAADKQVESLGEVMLEAMPILDAESIEDLDGGEPRAFAADVGVDAEGLNSAIEMALAEIRDDAADSGSSIVTGLGSVGLPLLDALGGVGKDLLEHLGKVGILLRRMIQFVIKAIEKLLVILGPLGVAFLEKLKEWLKDAKEGGAVGRVLGFAWESGKIEQEAKGEVLAAGDKLSDQRAREAADQLKALAARFDKQSNVVQLIIKALNFLAPKVIVHPQGPIFVGAAYGTAIAFVVYTGGDYADWYRLGENNLFDRVEGVRRIVRTAVV